MEPVLLQMPSAETTEPLPFDVKRVYFIRDTPQEMKRGFHAHRKLKQILSCPVGSCTITLDDGAERIDVRLDSPSVGLVVDGVIWREMSEFSRDCVLVVLASEKYDETDYIRDYEVFLAATRS